MPVLTAGALRSQCLRTIPTFAVLEAAQSVLGAEQSGTGRRAGLANITHEYASRSIHVASFAFHQGRTKWRSTRNVHI